MMSIPKIKLKKIKKRKDIFENEKVGRFQKFSFYVKF